ncbi:MAG: hypothetical protein M3357_13430, partial [Actinomycetota bacterium]|nr:hypothetical protein [Actinomycetota bacterium]
MAPNTKRRPAPSRPTSARRKMAATPRTARARTPKRPPLARRLLTSLMASLGRHGEGVLGVALTGTATLAALVLWLDAPYTGFASYLAGVVFGLTRHAVPLVLAALAGIVLTGRRDELARLGVGLSLVSVAAAGILHLARYDGGGSTFDAWRRAGGFLG